MSDSCDSFTQNLQDYLYFTAPGPAAWLPQCQLDDYEECGWNVSGNKPQTNKYVRVNGVIIGKCGTSYGIYPVLHVFIYAAL